MPIPQRKLIHLAGEIRHRLSLLQRNRYAEVIHRARGVLDDFAALRRQGDLLAVCLSRNWLTAAGSVCERISRRLQELPYYTSQVEQAVANSKMPVPPTTEILKDLNQAQDEFEDLRFDEESQDLVADTQPIVLDGLYLGPFAIRLHVPALSEMRRSAMAYSLVALDPHPAACNDAVTHPHISDERLCEGDAGAAITAALIHGRICDFLQLVRAVLTTYNPDSPYVALSDWEGRLCSDCGAVMAGDESYFCDRCESDFCGQCISCCRRCEDTICLGCLAECPVCGDRVCPACKTCCPECGRMLCLSCLEEGQCPCNEENQPQENEDDEDDQEDPAQERRSAQGGQPQEHLRPGPAGRQAATEAA